MLDSSGIGAAILISGLVLESTGSARLLGHALEGRTIVAQLEKWLKSKLMVPAGNSYVGIPHPEAPDEIKSLVKEWNTEAKAIHVVFFEASLGFFLFFFGWWLIPIDFNGSVALIVAMVPGGIMSVYGAWIQTHNDKWLRSNGFVIIDK